MDLYTLLDLAARYLRPCTLTWVTGNPVMVFDPALTPAEQVIFNDLKLMAGFGITANITLAEFQALKPDLALGKAFLGIAAPTNAQAVAAEKAIIRVLGALLRS